MYSTLRASTDESPNPTLRMLNAVDATLSMHAGTAVRELVPFSTRLWQKKRGYGHNKIFFLTLVFKIAFMIRFLQRKSYILSAFGDKDIVLLLHVFCSLENVFPFKFTQRK